MSDDAANNNKNRKHDKFPRYDIDRDGKIDDSEVDKGKDLIELELKEEKADTQRRMAWVALTGMMIFTAALLAGFVSPVMISAMTEIVPMFYISCASIVGAYFGFTSWMTKG